MRTVIKHQNRKIYDTNQLKYVTLKDIKRLHERYGVRVLMTKTLVDVTEYTLRKALRSKQ